MHVRVYVYAFFTTPTFAALNTRPLSRNPFCVVWKHTPSSLSGIGVMKTAS